MYFCKLGRNEMFRVYFIVNTASCQKWSTQQTKLVLRWHPKKRHWLKVCVFCWQVWNCLECTSGARRKLAIARPESVMSSGTRTSSTPLSWLSFTVSTPYECSRCSRKIVADLDFASLSFAFLKSSAEDCLSSVFVFLVLVPSVKIFLNKTCFRCLRQTKESELISSLSLILVLICTPFL